MTTPNRQHIYIYDDPESKIKFLESTLRGQDWHAKIVYPAHDPNAAETINTLRESCTVKGYLFTNSIDTAGNHVLDLHHLGDNAHPHAVLSELGLVKGVGHLVTHPSITMNSLVEASKHGGKAVSHIMHDPARANGFINIVAEAFLFTSGFVIPKTEAQKEAAKLEGAKPLFTRIKNNIGNMKAHNWLQSAAYGMFFAQSFTYLFLAKNNNDTAFDQYRKKLDRTLKEGGDVENVNFVEKKDREHPTALSKVGNFMQHYPIQIGAVFNDVGMGLYSVRSVFMKNDYLKKIEESKQLTKEVLASPKWVETLEKAKRYTEAKPSKLLPFKLSGFHHDIAGAAVSMVAWSLLLMKPKEYTQEQEEKDQGHALQGAWHRFRANPQVASGLMTLFSSSSRISTSMINNNILQGVGESIYVGGDIALLFTKNDNYGSKNAKDVQKLAQKLADHIIDQPIVLGKPAQEATVEHLATFLHKKTLQEIKDNPHAVKFTDEELAERHTMLLREVKLRIRNQQDERMERLADAANHIVRWAPDAEQPKVIESMSVALSELPWIHAEPAELRQLIVESLARRPEIQRPKDEKELREAMVDVAELIPGVDKGATVTALHTVIEPWLSKQPQNQITKASHVARVASAVPSQVLA